MKFINKYTHGFEDVSLEPAALSPVYSRKDVDTSVQLTPNIKLQTPIIASPMADVCETELAIAIAKAGGIGCIHRFMDIDSQSLQVVTIRECGYQVLGAVGTTEDYMHRATKLVEAGVSGIIVDVAFLNERTLDVCKRIKDAWPDIDLISGNVATGAGFRMGIDAGLDAIRVGIGKGQACRTSRVTGVGVGLVTSLEECYEESVHYAHKPVSVICDGGMDTGGSFCKALAAGAHAALMGRAFAATLESPGRAFGSPNSSDELNEDMIKDSINRDQAIYKEYRGSASMEAQMVYKARGDIVTSEGVRSLVKVYGSVEDVLGRFNGALRSSMSYLGAGNLEQFKSNAIFRLVSQGVFNQQKARSLQSNEVTV
jgi:IMP dehydrogenase